MTYNVLLLEMAEKDIQGIYKYILKSGNKKAAIGMIGNLREACESLAKNPDRGHIPAELRMIGLFEYRQIIIKKYRIIYQISEPNVFIFGIVHGSRNISEVLRRRMML